jgi:cell division protein FtsB
MEAYQMGLIDRIEVLKKNPEIFDKEGVIKRMSEIAQLRQTVEQMEEQVKTLEGDLQTAQRESVSDRKRVEVEKFKSKLVGVKADAEARGKVQVGNITNAVKLEAEKFKSRMGEEGSAPDMFETL